LIAVVVVEEPAESPRANLQAQVRPVLDGRSFRQLSEDREEGGATPGRFTSRQSRKN
jgi:hypothetical protein